MSEYFVVVGNRRKCTVLLTKAVPSVRGVLASVFKGVDAIVAVGHIHTVQTFTVCAEIVTVVWTAAVAAIPVTATVVVVIVAWEKIITKFTKEK